MLITEASHKKIVLCFIATILATESSYCQASKEHNPFQTIIAEYHNKIPYSHHLYNGQAYKEYNSLSGEHPYFLDSDWIDGSVTYDGITYNNVPLRFNLEREDLVLQHRTSYQSIKLNNELVTQFTLSDHKFYRIAKTENGLDKGFYEQLCSGYTILLAKRNKLFIKKSERGSFIGYFKETVKYYLKDGNSPFFKVKNVRDVLTEIGVEKKEIKSIKASVQDRESLLVEVIKLKNNKRLNP